MAKKYENMTMDEKIAYNKKKQQRDREDREILINQLSYDQRMAVINVDKWLSSVLDVALYPDMGGIRMVSAYELQELSDASDTLKYQFNIGVQND